MPLSLQELRGSVKRECFKDMKNERNIYANE
jgi:hypothetical protein